MAVGIFDSGLGGLTVLDAVAKRLPDVPFVYFGDNAHTPYGVRDAAGHLRPDHAPVCSACSTRAATW
jgi:glutamate racemase